MLTITDKQLSVLDEVMWDSMCAYYDRETNTIVYEWDHDEYSNVDWGMFDDDDAEKIKARAKELAGNPQRYARIRLWQDSREGYRVMASFVAQLPEDKYRYKMEAALEGHKPFRNFRRQVDDSPYLDDWYAWKNAANLRRYRAAVERALEEE